jgi:hypothetical protein
VRTKDKERLALGVIWLLATGLVVAGRNGRFGDSLNHYALMLSSLCTGLLVRTFIPEPEKWDPISYGIRIAVYLIAIAALIALVGFIADL